MKREMVNKVFVLHTSQCYILRLAIITRKTTIKLDILKGEEGEWKRVLFCF